MTTPTGSAYWEDDKDYSSEDWQYEVTNNTTRLSYWDWVANSKERDSST